MPDYAISSCAHKKRVTINRIMPTPDKLRADPVGYPYLAAETLAPGTLDLSVYNLDARYNVPWDMVRKERTLREMEYGALRHLDTRAPNYAGQLPDPAGCVPAGAQDALQQEFAERGEQLANAMAALGRLASKRREQRVHEGVACVVQRVTHELAFVTPVPATHAFGAPGPWDVLPVTRERCDWCDEAPLEVNLGRALTDAVVGTCFTNALRDAAPNFRFYYGWNLVDDAELNIPVPHLLKERLHPASVDLRHARHLIPREEGEEALFSLFLQVFLALAVASERCAFVHNDLRVERVFVVPLLEWHELRYALRGGDVTLTTRWLAVIDNFTYAHVEVPVPHRAALIARQLQEDDVVVPLGDAERDVLHTGVLNYATNLAPWNPRSLSDVARLVSSAARGVHPSLPQPVYSWLSAPLFGGEAPPLSRVASWWEDGRGAAPAGVDVDARAYALHLLSTLPRNVAASLSRVGVPPLLAPGGDPLRAVSPYLASITRSAPRRLPLNATPKQIAKRPFLFRTARSRAREKCTYVAVSAFEEVQRAASSGGDASALDPLARSLVSAEFAYGPLHVDERLYPSSAVVLLARIRGWFKKP